MANISRYHTSLCKPQKTMLGNAVNGIVAVKSIVAELSPFTAAHYLSLIRIIVVFMFLATQL